MPDTALALDSFQRVHFVGVAGAGMAALATLLLRMGKEVSGSDLGSTAVAAHLRESGARVIQGHQAANVDGAEIVIRSAAVPDDNAEVVEGRRRGLPVVKLAEAVGALMRTRRGVAIAGTHGKTTTTALTAWLLERAGQEPLALIGAEALNFGESALLGDGPMVVEADEFDRRFLTLSPEIAVVTSVESDHLDYFRDFAEISAVFQQFVDLLPADGLLLICADDPGAMALTAHSHRDTYGFAVDAVWRASDYVPLEGGGCRFTLHSAGRAFQAEMALSGEHNVRNALAAIAVADYFGIGLRAVLAVLPDFKGTRRRFETKGRPDGLWVVDDYAHHPTAVAATLSAAREVAPHNDLWAVFQPHTTNRTAALFEEFAASFGAADHALLLPIYQPSGREAQARDVTSVDLAQRMAQLGHPDARYVPDFDAATQLLQTEAQSGSLVLVMGAGDVTRLADRLAVELGGAA
jgi:UDP-N-acetylmuramate--alanine ligase